MRQYLHWKTYLVIIALGIVGATLYYTSGLATRLATEEKKNVQQFAEGIRFLATATSNEGQNFGLSLVSQNTTIPIMIVDEADSIQSFKNLDTSRVSDVNAFLRRKLKEFKAEHAPIEIDYGWGMQNVYYGDSFLLRQLRYFPYVQLTIILLFLGVVVIAISVAQRSIQNQVWVGLSKETAHQLGTPLSALSGWLELLRAEDENNEAVVEMEKDLDRLKLVAERFSKVGSEPQLHEEDLLLRLKDIVDYMQKRAPNKVRISLKSPESEIPVLISGPLFDWVMENLIRNALDAMGGEGRIDVLVSDNKLEVVIDVTDTGKGIPRHQLRKVFTPGFTTKKRGWGLGLTLARRIIRQYHHGTLMVHKSEVGKGTTFRIVLRR
jgi:two-component sensor histidine kinase